MPGLCAEREGFEPPVPSQVRLISNQVHSTTLPPLLLVIGDWSLVTCMLETHTSQSPINQLPNFRGETGIRTPDTLVTYTHFPGALLKPLGHLSFFAAEAFAMAGQFFQKPCLFLQKWTGSEKAGAKVEIHLTKSKASAKQKFSK